MNLCESLSYEPTGAGTRWMTRLLSAQMPNPRRVDAPVISKEKRRSVLETTKARRYNLAKSQPALRSAVSRALWRVIVSRPDIALSASEWLDRAGLETRGARVHGSTSMHNLCLGGWVTLNGGKYRRNK